MDRITLVDTTKTVTEYRQSLRVDPADVTQAHDRLMYAMLTFAGERDCEKLLDLIVNYAMNIAHADGAILYLREENELKFSRVRSEAHGLVSMESNAPESIPGLPLRDPQTDVGLHHNAAVHVALTGEIVNIADIYENSGFDFSGTTRMDERYGYRTKSMLFVPLKDHNNDVTAVLALFNACDPTSGEVTAFPEYLAQVIEALALQAGVTYDNHRLIKAQKELFESFVQSIANAIDAKSPYTSGHCKRVPVLHEMIAEAACDTEDGVFADFEMTEDEKYELRMAAWLHDCGKIAIPEHIMDKATKLEGLTDGISEVATRLEIIKRDLEISCLKKTLLMPEKATEYRHNLVDRQNMIDSNRDFLAELNSPDTCASDDTLRRIGAIAAMTWKDWDGNTVNLLSELEIENLSVRQGTLNESERRIVNSHVDVTIDMLENLKLPHGLREIPAIAGAHHERMDGTGYPRGLTGNQMSFKAKMLAVADIFEALTANDRPYKRSKTLNQSIAIMATMRDDSHIDPDVFSLFLNSRVWFDYAVKYMDPMLIDTVDVKSYRRDEFDIGIEKGLALAAE